MTTTKLDLDAENVIQADLTVDMIRNSEEGAIEDHLGDVLDEAQAKVFNGEFKTAWLVIRVTE